ncbi:3-keto-5-aminohexanoate cleavage protein [Bradyrhizobium sp. CCGB20]|uniref:3-keto-5-aminohexanoate cleavage protein n=1 Tax=unclassified Bradyrhizobium TaxID=2631580 RepID=UPI0035C707CC
MAEDVYRCYDAGASIVAPHARRRDDSATCNLEIYQDINAQVRHHQQQYGRGH